VNQLARKKRRRKIKQNKYYRVGNKLRVHGYNKKGRWVILGFENIEDLKGYNVPTKGGKFKIVEWVFNFTPTNKAKKPSGLRNFEVRVQLPEGRTDIEVENIAREIMIELCNETMVDYADIASKRGKDTIKYSKNDEINWMVVDTLRPQYRYPKKKKWGRYSDV